MVLPNAPAVINAQVSLISFPLIKCRLLSWQVIGLHNWLVTTGGDLDLAIAMYYDLPVVKYSFPLLLSAHHSHLSKAFGTFSSRTYCKIKNSNIISPDIISTTTK